MSGHLYIVQAPMSLVKAKAIKGYAFKTASTLNLAFKTLSTIDLARIHLLVSSALSQAKDTPQSLLPS